MSKHIQFTRDVGDYKVGQFSEVADVVATQFINMNVAKPAPEDLAERSVAMAAAQMTASIEATALKQREEIQAALKALAIPQRDFARPKHVSGRNGDGYTDYTSEVDKKRGVGDWFRCVMRTMIVGDTEARTVLERPWEEGGYGCYRVDHHGERGMVEGVGSLGGYTTPVIYEQQVFEVAAEQSVLVTRAEVKPLGNRQVEWPALNQYVAPTAGQAAWFGGMQVFRKGEDVQRTEKDLSFKKIQMLANDLTAYTELSRDLVMDSTIPIDNYIVRLMGQAIGWREDWEAFNGNGVNQFLGLMNSPALLPVTRHIVADRATTQAPNPIFAKDVFAMLSRMIVGARDPVWFCHPYSMANIEALTSPSGAFMYIPNTTLISGGGNGEATGGMTYRPAGTLMGLPIFRSEKVPPPSGTNDTTNINGPLGELLLIDCKSYWVGRRSGLEVGLSEHFKFDTDQLAIRAKVRNDGKPGQLAPIYLADGSASNQVSGFVALAKGGGTA